jgi:hypothetical protein
MSRIETAVARDASARILALSLTLGALVLALFLPPLSGELPPAGQRALIVTVITIVLWTSEVLEPGVTALLSVTLLALTGAAGNVRDALQGFAKPGAVLPGRRADDGCSRRAQRAGRAAGPHRPHEGARAEPGGYLQLVLAFPVLTFVLPSATTLVDAELANGEVEAIDWTR